MFTFISKLFIVISVKKFKMSFIDQRAKRMTTKLVKERIKVFVFEPINDNNSPTHFELEKACLTISKS